jgi:hypothetical protein
MSNLFSHLEFALSLKRPDTGTGVTKLCDYIVNTIKATGKGEVSVDYSGNLHCDLRSDPAHCSLFTSHVDTVHKADGNNSFRYNQQWLEAGTPGNCLGADDGAGVALLLHMIENNVPGYYIFFQGEERGGRGSSWLAENMPDLLYEFNKAVAFDRKDVFSVITHQAWGRCCSDAFADSLSAQLNLANEGFMYTIDDTGLYTDTAEFINFIPECTNVSVGYYNEHTPNEKLDTYHFEDLGAAVLEVKWDELTIERDPDEVEPFKYPDPVGSYTNYPTYNRATSFDNEDLAYAYYEKTYGAITTEQALIDAIADAKAGLKTDLCNLVAEFVMPEDPDMCVKFLDRSRLTEAVLLDCESMLATGFDESQVFEFLFDKLYKE